MRSAVVVAMFFSVAIALATHNAPPWKDEVPAALHRVSLAALSKGQPHIAHVTRTDPLTGKQHFLPILIVQVNGQPRAFLAISTRLGCHVVKFDEQSEVMVCPGSPRKDAFDIEGNSRDAAPAPFGRVQSRPLA